MLRLELIGNLTGDAELKEIDNWKVINFSVAHNEKHGQKEKVTYIRCAWWFSKDKRAAVVDFLKKGTQVFVEGTPDATAYTNQAGNSVASLELNIARLQLLGGGGQQNRSATVTTQPTPPTTPTPANEDDLPF